MSELSDTILRTICNVSEGLTASGVAVKLGMEYRTVQPRVSELVSFGHLKDSGRKLGNSTVWVAGRPKPADAEKQADDLIAAEIGRQGRMWGEERDDVTSGELQHAAMAQIEALYLRQEGYNDAFGVTPDIYPKSWCGFRDYGSDVANLVVAVAFLRQEIARKIRAGEPTNRTSRNVVEQPYCELNQPNVIEP